MFSYQGNYASITKQLRQTCKGNGLSRFSFCKGFVSFCKPNDLLRLCFVSLTMPRWNKKFPDRNKILMRQKQNEMLVSPKWHQNKTKQNKMKQNKPKLVSVTQRNQITAETGRNIGLTKIYRSLRYWYWFYETKFWYSFRFTKRKNTANI